MNSVSSRMLNPPRSLGIATVSSRMKNPPSSSSSARLLAGDREVPSATGLRASASRAASKSLGNKHVSSRIQKPPSSSSFSAVAAFLGSSRADFFAAPSPSLASASYPPLPVATESENMLIISPQASLVQIVIVGSCAAARVPSSSAVHRAPARTFGAMTGFAAAAITPAAQVPAAIDCASDGSLAQDPDREPTGGGGAAYVRLDTISSSASWGRAALSEESCAYVACTAPCGSSDDRTSSSHSMSHSMSDALTLLMADALTLMMGSREGLGRAGAPWTEIQAATRFSS
mmetsp:Transcript_3548/g.11851  ORF Transcript_3548/g.11851 Transcript_3548/m.11851 type:complete len:289 (-) Transcript_3548:1349-2215(-)